MADVGLAGIVALHPSLQSLHRGAGQLTGLFLDFSDGFGDLVHVAPDTDEHGLFEPDRSFAELVVFRAVVSLLVFGKLFLGVNGLEGARAEGLFEEGFLIQRRVSTRSGNAFRLESLQETRAWQPGKMRAVI